MLEWNIRIGEQDITNTILGVDFGQGESQSVESVWAKDSEGNIYLESLKSKSPSAFEDEYLNKPIESISKRDWKSKAEDIEYENC